MRDRDIESLTDDYLMLTLSVLAWILSPISSIIKACFSDSFGCPKASGVQVTASNKMIGDVLVLFRRSNGFAIHINTLSKYIHALEKGLNQWLWLDAPENALNVDQKVG
jgi:predicted transcriptional regulator with HTH domain